MIDLGQIDSKKKKLENARSVLKGKFFGIDNQIDSIIDRISLWYIFPDLNTRPAIVCLWGMTGVGKTDLVRNLASLLDLGDAFHEIQLSGDTDSYKTMQRALHSSRLEPNTQGILLLDEIQRYRTVTEDGHEKNEYTYSDLWMLLSDGRLPCASKTDELFELLFELQEQTKVPQEVNTKGKKSKKNSLKAQLEANAGESPKEYNISRWRARYIKEMFLFPEPIETIMHWNADDVFQKIQAIQEQDALNRNYDNYSKLLIIISGNLDEAFQDAFDVDETDNDVDAVHEKTKRIDVLTIKAALLRRFKPEQIARFGNNHVLYSTLPRFAFYNIIQKALETYINSIEQKVGIKLEFLDDSVHQMLFNNSVFPTQGTRPVFSTISDFTNVCFPAIILDALEKGKTHVELYFDKEHLCAVNGPCVKFDGMIDKIRKKSEMDQHMVRIVAVHEAGHALAQMLMFKRAPLYARISLSGGHAWSGNFARTVKSNEAHVKLLYAGQAAEEVVFGPDRISSGAVNDITRATALVALGIREWGFSDGQKSRIVVDFGPDSNQFDIDDETTNRLLKSRCVQFYNETRDMMQFNQDLLLKISQRMIENKKVSSQELVEIFQEKYPDSGIGVTTLEDSTKPQYVEDYIGIYEEWSKKK